MTSLAMPWLLHALRLPGWTSLLLRYVGLEALYLARRELGVPASGDPRVREDGGALPGLWWHLRVYAPVDGRHRYRVWLLPHARPEPVERWVGSREDAVAWVVVGALAPEWLVLTEDGDDPWVVVRSLGDDEVSRVKRRMGGE